MNLDDREVVIDKGPLIRRRRFRLADLRLQQRFDISFTRRVTLGFGLQADPRRLATYCQRLSNTIRTIQFSKRGSQIRSQLLLLLLK